MEKLPAVILILCTFTEILGSSRASCPVRNNGDPCTNAGKIDNQYRSIRHKYDRRSPALCDYLLQPGWYRFTSWVGGEIPTSAPAPNSCGTVAPIWMRVDRGTHPDTIGVNVPATACVNLNNLANGCYQSIDICLRKCTGDYYVYYLLPPQGCSMAYCAGNKEPCKRGFSGPNCTADVKAVFHSYMLPKPLVNATTHSNKAVMECHLQYMARFDFPNWKNVSYEIKWYKQNKLAKTGEKQCITKESECAYQPQKIHLEADPGSTVFCQVRMKFTTHPDNVWSSWRRSNDYYVGIKVRPAHFKISRCNTPFNIVLTTTVPIHIDGLFLPINIETTHINSNGQQFEGNMPIFEKCRNKAFKNSASAGTTYNIKVQSVCDTMNNFNKLLITMRSGADTDAIWGNYSLPSVKVSIEHTEHKRCSCVNDPHFTTFDGRRYTFLKLGDFMLFKDNKASTEIHTRMWTCSERLGATCTCGVAIRERNDVLILSTCNSKLEWDSNARTPLSICRPRGYLLQGWHITKYTSSYQNALFTVILPSGTKVEIVRRSWGLKVFVTAFKTNQTANNYRGLCGNFNGDMSDEDEFNDGGDSNHYTDPTKFAESWRLKRQESFFHSLPPYTPESNSAKYCKCEEKGACGSPQNNAIHRPPPPGNPVSSEKLPEYCKEFSDSTNLRALQRAEDRIRKRREAQEHTTEERKENATRICKGFIEDSVAGKKCSALSNMETASYLESCIFDVMITGVTDFALSALESLKGQCLDEAYNNVTLYTKDSNGNPLEPPSDIVENLCPNECSNRGNCSNSTCICEEGFTLSDCSMPINAVPELLGVNEVGLCDVREESCNNTRIIGDGFIASENLTCHATEFKVFGNNWSPNAEQFELPGEQFDLYVVRCDLPSPPTKIGDMDNPGTPAGGLRIRISNNKLDTSREQKTFVSYDSVCIKCNKTGSCGLRADSCIINGHCFANEEPNPKDWCQQCFPTTSQFTWNRRRVNSNPIFTTPPVQFALVDEMLVLHIHARDPENRTVTYSIRSTDAQGYSFTLDGQLNYTMTSLSKTFTFVATDECNASDTMTVNLRVMECLCRNRGSCYPHPYYPRGSGQYECACPVGFNGSRCEVNINDCESNTCVNGTCLDGVANYTCLCDVGFKGQLCNEKVSNCSDDACYPGVNCTDISGGIACGPCPVGLTGNGKSCVTPTTTRRPTTTKPSTSQSTSKAISTRKQQESTFKDQTATPTSEPKSIVPRPAKDNPQKTSKTKVIVIAVSGSVAAVIIIAAASLLCRRKYVYHVSHQKKRTQVHDSQEIKQADRHAYENPDYQEITEHTYERANKVSTAAYENIALDTVPNFDVPDKGVDPHLYQELKALKETYQPLEHKPVLPPIPSKNPEKPHENDYE